MNAKSHVKRELVFSVTYSPCSAVQREPPSTLNSILIQFHRLTLHGAACNSSWKDKKQRNQETNAIWILLFWFWFFLNFLLNWLNRCEMTLNRNIKTVWICSEMALEFCSTSLWSRQSAKRRWYRSGNWPETTGEKCRDSRAFGLISFLSASVPEAFQNCSVIALRARQWEHRASRRRMEVTASQLFTGRRFSVVRRNSRPKSAKAKAKPLLIFLLLLHLLRLLRLFLHLLLSTYLSPSVWKTCRDSLFLSVAFAGSSTRLPALPSSAHFRSVSHTSAAIVSGGFSFIDSTASSFSRLFCFVLLALLTICGWFNGMDLDWASAIVFPAVF